MKTRYIIILSLFLGLLACHDDLLDKYPLTDLSPETFWENEKDVLGAVNGLYPGLPDIEEFMTLSRSTDLAVHSQPGWQNALNLNSAGIATTEQFEQRWEAQYKKIAAANYFLDNVDKAAVNISPTLLARTKSEAIFIRSFIYMQMVMEFGDVPYITKVLTKEESFEVTRTPANDIWDALYNDLTDVAGDLPTKYSGNDRGRITAGAANMLRAKCMLYAGQYQKAYNAAKEVISSGVYALQPSFGDIFGYAGEYGKEVILSRQYARDINPNDIFFEFSPIEMRKVGNNDQSLTKDLIDMFPMADGKDISDPSSGWNPLDPYTNRDPRLEQTIFIPAFSDDTEAFMLWNDPTQKLDPRPGSGTDDEIGVTKERNATGFFIRKYVNIEDINDPQNCGTDFILMRYAETLLIAAEALIELNKDLPEAAGYINQVRLRAGMPALAASGVNTGNQSELREALRKERVLELAIEGWRRYDILRWRIAEEVITGNALGMSYLGEDSEIITIDTGHPRSFNTEKDYLYAIPDSERRLNPNLTQNPGY